MYVQKVAYIQSQSRYLNLCSYFLPHYSSPQDPPAQAPPPLQPRLHPFQEEARHLQLQRAAAHRHGDLSSGAGGGRASAAAGGGGAAAHHPAVTHGEMRAEQAQQGSEGRGLDQGHMGEKGSAGDFQT